MAIIGVRKGETLAEAWNSIRQRKTLAGNLERVRTTDNPMALAHIVTQRQSSLLLSMLGPIVEIEVAGKKLGVMEREVTVGLFRQVMEGYEITGENADKLKAILDDSSKVDEVLNWVNLFDAREFAKRLGEQTNREFRVYTEAEFERAKGRLSGKYATWTETLHPDYPGHFVLRCLIIDLIIGSRLAFRPESRSNCHAVRLVGDK